MPTASNASPADADAIRTAFGNAIGASAAAVTYFQGYTDPQSPNYATDPSELANYQAGLIRAQKDLTLLQNQLDAFESDSDLGNVTAPSTQVVQQTSDLDTAVSTATAQDDATADILNNLSQLLTLLHDST